MILRIPKFASHIQMLHGSHLKGPMGGTQVIDLHGEDLRNVWQDLVPHLQIRSVVFLQAVVTFLVFSWSKS